MARTAKAKAEKAPRKARKAPARKKARKQTPQQKRLKVWPARFLKALSEQGSVTHACKKVGIGRKAAYENRDRDPAFADSWDEIVNRELDLVEDAVFKRARDGSLEPVYYLGAKVGQVRKWDSTLQIFVLRQRRPAKWAQAEKMKLEHEGDVTIRKISDEDAMRRIAMLLAMAAMRKEKAKK